MIGRLERVSDQRTATQSTTPPNQRNYRPARLAVMSASGAEPQEVILQISKNHKVGRTRLALSMSRVVPGPKIGPTSGHVFLRQRWPCRVRYRHPPCATRSNLNPVRGEPDRRRQAHAMTDTHDCILRLKAVLERTGLSARPCTGRFRTVRSRRISSSAFAAPDREKRRSAIGCTIPCPTKWTSMISEELPLRQLGECSRMDGVS